MLAELLAGFEVLDEAGEDTGGLFLLGEELELEVEDLFGEKGFLGVFGDQEVDVLGVGRGGEEGKGGGGRGLQVREEGMLGEGVHCGGFSFGFFITDIFIIISAPELFKLKATPSLLLLPLFPKLQLLSFFINPRHLPTPFSIQLIQPSLTPREPRLQRKVRLFWD